MHGLRSIRFRLMAAVNAAMALLLLAFLIGDYYHEIADRVVQTHLALEEEAKTLLPAILRLRPQGTEAIQQYVDGVCGQMFDASSPGHHIGVRLKGVMLQAAAHGRNSHEMGAAMQAAEQSPTRRATVGVEEMVIGIAQHEDATVYVSEYLTEIHRSARKQILWRLARIALLAAVATGVVNLVFLRMAAKPLEELVSAVRQIAQGRLNTQAGPFKAAELDYLAREINLMTSSLAEVERHRCQEMAKARRIQDHLLPRQLEVPGLNISHLYQPATEVAGDYYDVLCLPDRTWLLCIADVAGHGVPAALNAAMLKAFLLHAVEYHVTPGQILSFVNDRFTAISLEEVFASMLLVRWNPETATFEYASAGHEIAWLYSAKNGSLRQLPSTGLLLGIVAESTWTTETNEMATGDRLLMVTDGVTEAFDGRSEPFGRDRLAALFLQCSTLPFPEMARRIDETLIAYREGRAPTDDTTLLAIQFTGPETGIMSWSPH